MYKYKIKSGKGTLTLVKSGRLVGLKSKEDLSGKEFVNDEVFQNLGGFRVVTLDAEGPAIDDRLDEVRGEESVDLGTHVYYAEGSDKPMVPTGEIYITFEEGTSESEQLMVLDEFKLEIVERRDQETIIAAVTDQSPNPIKVAAALQEVSLVNMAEPDLDALLKEYDFAPPQDQLLSHQWHLKNTGRVADVNWPLKPGADAKVVEAWQRLGNMGDSGITVAVIDNGLDLSHPDLQPKVVHPYDIWNQSSDVLQGDARFTHGTPCASIAVATPNGTGIVGAAPNARFMPISGTSFSIRNTETMFDYCVKNGADVISCSWGTTDAAYSLNRPKEQAITYAATQGRNGKGCVIVFAAGNEDLDYLNFYAAHPDVIAVGASTSQDLHASYSNRGQELSVVAPSNGDWPIIAARAWWDQGLSYETGDWRYWRDGKSRGNHYKHFGGTSSAAPLVAGICALILSANPELTAAQVKQILERTADKIGAPEAYDAKGHSRKYGYGRVNAGRAVAEALRLRDAGGTISPPVEETVQRGQGLFEFDVKRARSEGYTVQVGVFAEYGNVLVKAEELQRVFGEQVLVHIDELNGKTVYRVMLGQFLQKSEASSLLSSLRGRGQDGYVRSLTGLA